MLSLRTLKNIQIGEFENFFKMHKVPRWSTRIQAPSSALKYQKILDIINEEIKSDEGNLTDVQVDDFLFEQLFYVNNNYQFIYKYNNFFADQITDPDVVRKYLLENRELCFNNSLTNTITFPDDIFTLCTSRLELQDNGLIRALNLIMKIDVLNLRHGYTNIFTGITIDIQRKLLLIKFGYSQFEDIDKEPLKLVKEIRDKLTIALSSLSLNIVSFIEEEPRHIIYSLFRELTTEAENILDQQIDQETLEEISLFLDRIKLKEIKDEYVEQIKAVVYQDTFDSLGDAPYTKGWVFRFHFREGDHTRATSTNEKRLPVYSSKTYWQLKELIHKEQQMYEAGFHWLLRENGPKEHFVDVRFESKNDTMILHYYYNNRQGRKEKEDFVLRKISQHLS